MPLPTPHLVVITMTTANRAAAEDAAAHLMTLASRLVGTDEDLGSASTELFEIPVGLLPRVANSERPRP